MAGKDIDTQLFFQLDDCLGYAWLRSEQRLGGLGQVEVLPYSLSDETELMKIHDFSWGDANKSTFYREPA